MAIDLKSTGLKLGQEIGTIVYDEASQLLLKLAQASIFAYNLAQTKQAPTEVKLSEGPPVAAARVSLDSRYIALQRSPGHLQFLELSSTKTFVQGAWKGRFDVMGFFWTSTPECSFVMITKSALETYQLQPNGQGLRLVQQYGHTVRWWKYSHGARVLLLGTGDMGIWIQAYQFTSGGILRLPPFQLAFTAPSNPGSSATPARLDPDSISVHTLYGKVYCAFVDRKERRLVLYRFYKDAILLQHQYDLPSANVKLGVTDDLLLVHHLRSMQALVIDVSAEAPMPRSFPVSFAASASDAGPRGMQDNSTWQQKLQFELPNLVINPLNREIYRSRVDVEAVAQACKSWPSIIGFLLRRTPALYSADLSRLVLTLLRDALVERVSMEGVRHLCDAINAHQAPRAGLQPRVLLTPQEVCREVFSWMHAEEAVDAQYLQAAIVEYRASALAFGVDLPLMQQILAFDVALQLAHDDQVAAEVTCSHEKDCKELAAQLEAWTQLQGHAQLANDMRARVDAHEQRAKSLLKQGKVLEAVRIIQQHNLNHLLSADLLDLAAKQGSVAAFVAVYRACLPGLKSAQAMDLESALQRYNLRALTS